jgi:hypothetical protein
MKKPMSLSFPAHPASHAQPPADAARVDTTRRSRWLAALTIILLGYALFGKGWAYIGLPPAYIGEIILIAGLLSFLTIRGWNRVLDLKPVWFILAMAAWGFYRTWPYVPGYGMDAFRDAVIWGYSAFAILILAHLLADPAAVRFLLDRYRRFIGIFLPGILLVWAIHRFGRDAIPAWPWAGNVRILDIKSGDVLCHLAGIFAFWVSGLAGRVRLPWMFLMVCCIVIMGSYNRGGLLSFMAVVGLCIMLRPHAQPIWRLVAVLTVGVMLFAATGISIQISDRRRHVSFEQLASNLISIGGRADAAELEGTKQWRLNWWSDIVAYTVHGPYFWHGKGFGINLADEDGYQVMADHSLRSPHNGHMTMLGRAGVPGLALWGLVQVSWAWGIFRAHARASRARQARWAGLFLFLLAYWVAFMANASFDVFIEGPMGGIWFWSIYGVGLAAMWLHRRAPETVFPHENPDRPQPLSAAGR